jgi:hypothetical protein
MQQTFSIFSNDFRPSIIRCSISSQESYSLIGVVILHAYYVLSSTLCEMMHVTMAPEDDCPQKDVKKFPRHWRKDGGRNCQPAAWPLGAVRVPEI